MDQEKARARRAFREPSGFGYFVVATASPASDEVVLTLPDACFVTFDTGAFATPLPWRSARA